MRENGLIDSNVDFNYLSYHSENFSGADISEVVRIAISYVIDSLSDDNQPKLSHQHFIDALNEVKSKRYDNEKYNQLYI